RARSRAPAQAPTLQDRTSWWLRPPICWLSSRCSGAPASWSPPTRGHSTSPLRWARRALVSMVLRAPSATARTAPGTGPSRRPTAGSGRSAWTRWQQRCESFSNDAAARASRMTPVRPRLSAVVIALNEEARLRACLESVAWADEIVVVDAESQDKTVQIAREFTEHVLVRPWPGFAAQKNFAL